MGRGPLWSAEDDFRLRVLARTKRRPESMAEELGRTPGAVVDYARNRGIRLHYTRGQKGRELPGEWTADEIAALRAGLAAGKSRGEIGREIKRSRRAVCGKAWRLGYRRRAPSPASRYQPGA